MCKGKVPTLPSRKLPNKSLHSQLLTGYVTWNGMYWRFTYWFLLFLKIIAEPDKIPSTKGDAYQLVECTKCR